MLNKIPLKKDHLLLAGALLMLIISYQLAFKKTISAWQLHHELSQSISTENGLNYQPGYLERKNRNLDRLITRYRIDSAEFRNNTINQLSELSARANCRITELPADDQNEHTGPFILHRVVFEGSYQDQVRLLDQLGQKQDIGILRSVSWGKRSGQRDELEKADLRMTIWLEILK